MKIKKNDNVQIMTGKDRGRQVKVASTNQKNGFLMLMGVNQYKKHRKPQSGGAAGEIITVSKPVKVANVALVCPKCKQVTRVGYKISDNKKSRICRKCGMEV